MRSTRTFRISTDGSRAFFLRSFSPFEPVHDLWKIDLFGSTVTDAKESLLVKVAELRGPNTGSTSTPEAEIARKERMREAAAGITTYSISDDGAAAAFAVNGDVYVALADPKRLIHANLFKGASYIKVSPNGKFLSLIINDELHVATIGPSEISNLNRISPAATENVSWGMPDFIAAEEMRRREGHWWSPDSASIVFAGVDQRKVNRWYVSTPTDPARKPLSICYPQAGTSNAELSLFLWRRGKGLTEVRWDHDLFPYLVQVRWRRNEPTIILQDRSQQSVVVLHVDVNTGNTSCIYQKRILCGLI